MLPFECLLLSVRVVVINHSIEGRKLMLLNTDTMQNAPDEGSFKYSGQSWTAFAMLYHSRNTHAAGSALPVHLTLVESIIVSYSYCLPTARISQDTSNVHLLKGRQKVSVYV